MNEHPIAAIVLAAGESTRMGRLKQLLPWAGATLIDWQARQALEAGATDVVVVLGHEAPAIAPAVHPPARIVVNDAYREGRASSLRAGAEALADDDAAVLILSVDQPRPAGLSRLLIECWRQTGAPIVLPVIGGRRDHPVLVDGALLPELRAVDEASLGLRAVVERHAAAIETLTVANPALAVNLNTPADYEAALTAFTNGEWRL